LPTYTVGRNGKNKSDVSESLKQMLVKTNKIAGSKEAVNFNIFI